MPLTVIEEAQVSGRASSRASEGLRWSCIPVRSCLYHLRCTSKQPESPQLLHSSQTQFPGKINWGVKAVLSGCPSLRVTVPYTTADGLSSEPASRTANTISIPQGVLATSATETIATERLREDRKAVLTGVSLHLSLC